MIQIKETDADVVWPVIKKIPEFSKSTTCDDIKNRLEKFSGALILVAEYDGTPAGFKIGYETEQTTFYSWFGGVIPEFRQIGIAEKLLKYQEQLVEKRGLKKISVKSMNRYRGMLCMLLKNDYRIEGYEDRGDSESSKILFGKNLF